MSDTIQSMTEELIEAIMSHPSSVQNRLGLMVLTATQFVGAGAGILGMLTTANGGPELDLVGYSEEITKMIIGESKNKIRQ